LAQTGDEVNAPTLLAEPVSHIQGDAGQSNISFYSEWISGSWLLSVGKTIQREIRRSPTPVPTASQAVSAATYLIKIANWNRTSQDIKRTLTAAFDAGDYPNCIKNLKAQCIEPSLYIDSLDKVGSCSILEGIFN